MTRLELENNMNPTDHAMELIRWAEVCGLLYDQETSTWVLYEDTIDWECTFCGSGYCQCD